MDLRDLTYFEIIAKTETYEDAAEILDRTKQALTKSVRRLETDIGGVLFEREGRGKVLTPLGEALLARTQKLRLSIDDIEREMADYARGAAGTLRIGTGTTPVEHLLPDACRALAREAPDVNIKLTIGMADMLKEQLRRGELDMILSPTEGSDQSDFDVDVVLRDEVVVSAGADHPLTGREVSLEELSRHDWVLQSQSMTMRAWLDAVFSSRNLPPPRAKVETNSISALPRMVEEMQLLTFTGRRSMQTLHELPHPDTTMPRAFAVLTRRGVHVSPAVERLRGILIDAADS